MADYKAFLEQLFGKVGVESDKSFHPFISHDPEGDCIQFFTKPDSYHAKRLNDLLTVYLSHETGEVTGAMIKGAKRFWRETLKKLEKEDNICNYWITL